MVFSRPEAPGPEAAALRVPLPAPYVYRTALKRRAAAGLDALGGLLLGRAPRPVDWGGVRRVAVLRLDHLGDLLNALPALRRLRRALPRARLDLWVGPWGEGLAGLFADADRVRVTPARWFRRPGRVEWPWADIRALGRGLRAECYDAVIDLRGDLRHHLAAYASGAPVRLGQTLTAGGFLLTHPGRWDAALHEQTQALALLDRAGVPAAAPGPGAGLKLPPRARARAAALLKRLCGGRRPVLVQAACGTLSKRWQPQAWARVLDGLPRGLPVVLLGSADERAEMLALAAPLKRKVAVAAGELDLPGLAAFLALGRLLLSVDSGPAHLAAAQGVPVLALYSGTNRVEQWAPRGPGVRLLRAAPPPCSPCELPVCPYGNACMRALDPEDVLAAARELLKGRR